MRYSVLNRATARVANTRDVSGRVTAKSVKHGFCAKTNLIIARRWLVLVTASMGLYLLLPNRGLAQNNQGQNDRGINGTYSVHITGYVITDSSGDKVPLAVAGRVTHFANGTESGVATSSFNGQLSTVPFTGTLTRNPDGVSWSETVHQTIPGGLTLHFILYPTPDGNIINEVETDSGTILAGVLTRGSPTRDEQ
jgi:hypothetical protein